MDLFSNTQNFSLYTVPIALALAFLPHTYAASLGIKKYDPSYPRKFTAAVTSDESIDKVTKFRILRAKAASENAFETLGFYAAAVAAANAAGVDVARLNLLTFVYVVSRALFNVTYIWLQDNRSMAPLRSLFWIVSIAVTMWLYIAAGKQMNA